MFVFQQHTVPGCLERRHRRWWSSWRRLLLWGAWLLGLLWTTGCRRAPSWPLLPASDAQATSLLTRQQRRFRSEPTPKARTLEQAFVWERLQQTPLSRWRVGWPAIQRWLQSQLAVGRAPQGFRWLLWGTFHDAGGQIDAFRRLLFHDGLQGWSLVALEALAADGRWRGVSRTLQRGDNGLLGRLLSTPGAGWKQLHRRQRAHNYTGWKYGYLHSISSLISVAKGRRIPVSGCDMSASLQRRLSSGGASVSQALRPSLRELHCSLALRRHLRQRSVQRGLVGVVWGMSHAMPGGFWRWLPKQDWALAVYVMGYRPNALSPEGRLGERLVLLDPLLLPLPVETKRGREALLLLPDQHMGGHWSRARTRLSAPLAGASRPARGSKGHPRPKKGLVVARSTRQGQLQIASHHLTLAAEKPVFAMIPAGCGPFVWKAMGQARMMSGRLCVPAGGKVELSLEPKRRRARKVLWLPHHR